MESKIKVCSRCKQMKYVQEFSCDKSRVDGLNNWCRCCRKRYSREWYEQNRERVKAYSEEWYKNNRDRRVQSQNLWKKSNRAKASLISSRAYAKKFNCTPCTTPVGVISESWNGRCHSCKRTEEETGRSLHLDHNHKTGKFRGWLCRDCNLSLGLLDDNVIRIHQLANYADRHESSYSMAV